MEQLHDPSRIAVLLFKQCCVPRWAVTHGHWRAALEHLAEQIAQDGVKLRAVRGTTHLKPGSCFGKLHIQCVKQLDTVFAKSDVPRPEDPVVAPQLIDEERIEQCDGLIHEPALHIRSAGDETDVVVTEDDTRNGTDDPAPILHRYAVQGHLLGSTNLFDRDRTTLFAELISISASKSRLHHHVAFSRAA